MLRTQSFAGVVGIVVVIGFIAAVSTGADNPRIEDDQKLLTTIGKPNEDETKAIGQQPESEIKNRIALLRQGRLAALRLSVEAIEAEFNAGFRGATVEVVMRAHARLAHAELEYSQSRADRIAALEKLVAASSRLELETRAKREVGALGGSDSDFYQAIEARLRAEEQLAGEYLAQRDPGQRTKKQ